MNSKDKQVFTNNTGYMRRSNKLKNQQINVSKLENPNYTLISQLPLETSIGPSVNTVSRV